MTGVLPLEIWRQILRSATVPPSIEEITDTSVSSVSGPFAARLRDDYCDSLETKLALSLVSRAFHKLAEEFLCEWLVICETRQLAAVGALLTGGPDGIAGDHKANPGWWCRRLQLEFPFSALSSTDMPIIHAILSACPRLTVLICISSSPLTSSTSPTAGNSGQVPFPPTFRIPPDLLRHLATTCPTLRRIEFTGLLTIDADSLEEFIYRMPNLEVACLDAVTDPIPSTSDLLFLQTSVNNYDTPQAQSVPALHTLSFGIHAHDLSSLSLYTMRKLFTLVQHAGSLHYVRFAGLFSPFHLAVYLPTALPNLSLLIFEIHHHHACLTPSRCPAGVFPSLKHITITCANELVTTQQVGGALESILELKQAGKMDMLRDVHVWDSVALGRDRRLERLEVIRQDLVGRFQALGVQLVIRKQNQL